MDDKKEPTERKGSAPIVPTSADSKPKIFNIPMAVPIPMQQMAPVLKSSQSSEAMISSTPSSPAASPKSDYPSPSPIAAAVSASVVAPMPSLPYKHIYPAAAASVIPSAAAVAPSLPSPPTKPLHHKSASTMAAISRSKAELPTGPSKHQESSAKFFHSKFSSRAAAASDSPKPSAKAVTGLSAASSSAGTSREKKPTYKTSADESSNLCFYIGNYPAYNIGISADTLPVVRAKKNADLFDWHFAKDSGKRDTKKIWHLGPRGVESLYKDIPEHPKHEIPIINRRKFIQFVVSKWHEKEKLGETYLGQEKDSKALKQAMELRRIDPAKASITVLQLLGPEGKALFESALQEEMADPRYRAAVFEASTTLVLGKRFKEMPVIMIAGPSSSGKSYQTQFVLQQIECLPRQEGPATGNFLVAVDNGIGRELSQMRTLTVSMAVKLGYGLIIDLEKVCKPHIGDAKKLVQQAAMDSEEPMGIIVPCTFSKIFKLPKISSLVNDDVNLMKKISNSPDRQLIFANVVAADQEPSTMMEFAVTVAFTGDQRSAGFFEGCNLALNARDLLPHKLPESKVYESQHFLHGVLGSRNAQVIYETIQAENGKRVLVIELPYKRKLFTADGTPITSQQELDKAKMSGLEIIVSTEDAHEQWLCSGKGMAATPPEPFTTFKAKHGVPDLNLSLDFMMLQENVKSSPKPVASAAADNAAGAGVAVSSGGGRHRRAREIADENYRTIRYFSKARRGSETDVPSPPDSKSDEGKERHKEKPTPKFRTAVRALKADSSDSDKSDDQATPVAPPTPDFSSSDERTAPTAPPSPHYSSNEDCSAPPELDLDSDKDPESLPPPSP